MRLFVAGLLILLPLALFAETQPLSVPPTWAHAAQPDGFDETHPPSPVSAPAPASAPVVVLQTGLADVAFDFNLAVLPSGTGKKLPFRQRESSDALPLTSRESDYRRSGLRAQSGPFYAQIVSSTGRAMDLGLAVGLTIILY